MSETPIGDSLENVKETPIFNSLARGEFLGYDDTVSWPEVNPDTIPKIYRTIGYVSVAAFATLSPVVLGIPAIFIPESAGQIAQVWAILGTVITGFGGFVGVKYRPTKTS